ncbi:MAG: hypothetical protein Q7T90_02475 [Thiobacillus sp.]|nr:hypothetical protein [Thiobacillus sp.]
MILAVTSLAAMMGTGHPGEFNSVIRRNVLAAVPSSLLNCKEALKQALAPAGLTLRHAQRQAGY